MGIRAVVGGVGVADVVDFSVVLVVLLFVVMLVVVAEHCAMRVVAVSLLGGSVLSKVTIWLLLRLNLTVHRGENLLESGILTFRLLACRLGLPLFKKPVWSFGWPPVQ